LRWGLWELSRRTSVRWAEVMWHTIVGKVLMAEKVIIPCMTGYLFD